MIILSLPPPNGLTIQTELSDKEAEKRSIFHDQSIVSKIS